MTWAALLARPTVHHAVMGVMARAAGDDGLKALLGTKEGGMARVYDEWPPDRKEESDFPRVTLTFIPGRVIRPGFYEARVQADAWVWKTGQAGGRRRLAMIDQRLEDLFDEAHWQFEGARLYGYTIPSSAPEDDPDLLRALREIFVGVGPALYPPA